MFVVLVEGGQPGRDMVVPADLDAGQDRGNDLVPEGEQHRYGPGGRTGQIVAAGARGPGDARAAAGVVDGGGAAAGGGGGAGVGPPWEGAGRRLPTRPAPPRHGRARVSRARPRPGARELGGRGRAGGGPGTGPASRGCPAGTGSGPEGG